MMSEIGKSERNQIEKKEIRENPNDFERTNQIEHEKSENLKDKIDELNNMEKYLETIKLEKKKEEKEMNIVSAAQTPISHEISKSIPLSEVSIDRKKAFDDSEEERQINKPNENIKVIPRSILEQINKQSNNPTAQTADKASQQMQTPQQSNQTTQERPIRIIPIPQSSQQSNQTTQERPIRIIPMPQQSQWEQAKKNLKEKWQKAKVEIKKKYKEIAEQIKTELNAEQNDKKINTLQGQMPIMKVSIPDSFSGYSCHFCNHVLNPELVERVFKGIPTVCEYCGVDLNPNELLK